MAKKITLIDAKRYLVASVVYLDKRPSNFVVIFRDVKDKTFPPVRAVVKCKEERPVVTVSSSKFEVEISNFALAEFKNMATETVSSLHCKSKGEAND